MNTQIEKVMKHQSTYKTTFYSCFFSNANKLTIHNDKHTIRSKQYVIKMQMS